jgi:enoyl-[acyl-carrier protein] reductase I
MADPLPAAAEDGSAPASPTQPTDRTMTATSALSGLLAGKKGLIVGVANQNSIAWACAEALGAAGMELAFTYQGEVMRDRVTRTVATLGESPLYDLDVRDDAQVDSVFGELRERWGRLDFLLHSVAFAPKPAMSNPFLQTTREDFLTAHEISAYSLVGLSRAAAPLMTEGGSIVTMSYYGSQKAVPGYNVMGVAKAALEASVRYLAVDLGPQGIRVNAVSAGAINTLAARGVAHFRDLLRITGERAALRRTVEPSEVGNATLFLASDLSSGVTGETLYVDAGFSITAG